MQSMPTGSNQQGQQSKTLSWQAPAPSAPKAPTSDKPKVPPMPPKKVEGGSSGRSGYVGIFVMGLIVGVLLGWGIVGLRGGNSNTNTATSTSSTSSSNSSSNNTSGSTNSGSTSGSITLPTNTATFSVVNQAAGLQVAVTNVNVSQPTWVVIYESNNGTLGRALGAHLFFPASVGGANSGTVDLLRGTMPGQKYFAGESLDDGDHIFSTQNDKPVRDDKGNPVVVSFSTN